ncbi:MAG: nucleoside deaminase [Ilumatobacteraceae bacterium]
MVDAESAMRIALEEAELAASLGEVPVGAVVLFEGSVVSRAGNRRESSSDPLGHAELLVIQDAASKLGSWKLTECTLVVTLEPCIMCAGAILNARIPRLMFGAYDLDAGGAGSRYNLLDDPRLNHRVEASGGILQAECSDLLASFFTARR